MENLTKAVLQRGRRYLGWDLPRRRLHHNFQLNPLSKRGKRPRTNGFMLAREILPLRNEPNAYLQALLKRLQGLNHYRVGWRTRLSTSRRLTLWFLPLAQRCIQAHSVNGGVPENLERQQQLDLISSIARQLRISYAHAFQADYDGSRFHYARSRRRVYFCAFRILEFVQLEQRVRALRYQALSEQAWRQANSVFHLMREYETVDFPLAQLSSRTDRQARRNSRTLADLYGAIQTFSLMDPFAWPTEQQSFINRYQDALDQPVSIHPADSGLSQDCRISYADGPGPATPTTDTSKKGPSSIINFHVLAQSIRNDYRDLINAREQRNPFLVPRAFTPFQDAMRLSIGSLMRNSIDQPHAQQEVAQLTGELCDLWLHVGFRNIYLQSRALFSDSGQLRDSRKLADTLAQRSAVFGEDHTAATESQWFVIRQDQHHLLLKTQETGYTTRMVVGSPVAYGVGDKDLQQPRLGWISRIQRPEKGVVIVEMQRLASFAQALSLESVMEEQATSSKPKPTAGLLVHDKRFAWGLLLPKNNPFWENSRVELLQGKRRARLKLGKVRYVSAQFYLFKIAHGAERLAAPVYPAKKTEQQDNNATPRWGT